MKVRVLIADDEQHICMELEDILKQEAQVEIVAICSSGDKVLQAISETKPDIAFLDIAMPGIDGISIGHYLKEIKKPPYIIYITAYDQYAIEAIKVGAKGYILKPFSSKDILEAIKIAIENFVEEDIFYREQPHTTFRRISVTLNEKIMMIDEKDIVITYAKNREVYIKTNSVNYSCNYSLSKLETKLDPNVFLRCHRNYIVNLYKIKQVNPWFNNSYLLIMDDSEKTEVPISRSNKNTIKKILDL